MQEMLALAHINKSLLDKTGVKALCKCATVPASEALPDPGQRRLSLVFANTHVNLLHLLDDTRPLREICTIFFDGLTLWKQSDARFALRQWHLRERLQQRPAEPGAVCSIPHAQAS